jgi:hypothetical protein
MPRYMQISSSGIRIGKKTSGLYSAVTVASADAFFLVIGKSAFRSTPMGGLLGAVIDHFAGKKPLVETDSEVIETDLAELPQEITADADWPIKQPAGPVIVIPRKGVESVRYSFWQWGIFVQTKNIEFRIEPPFFGRKRVLKYLREVGWEL